MLNKERMYKIMTLLNEQGFVSVKELMEKLQVSRSSIMRDLIELENQGLIQREHGGASLKKIQIFPLIKIIRSKNNFSRRLI